jgi:hypothetical protein
VGIDERPGEPVVVADAVPSGPFEPPPRPPVATPKADATRPDAGDAAPALAAAGGERATARRPAAGRRAAARQHQAVERDEAEPFVWIPGADTIEPGLGLQVVRMRVPQARWEGRPPGSDAVEADVLMGEDGLARAVRVVRASSRR